MPKRKRFNLHRTKRQRGLEDLQNQSSEPQPEEIKEPIIPEIPVQNTIIPTETVGYEEDGDRNVSLRDVEELFPGQKVFETGNGFQVLLVNNETINIEFVQDIVSPEDDKEALGSWQITSGNAIIKLTDLADKGILKHEQLHAAIQLGVVTPEDQATLFNAFGSEEAIADAYSSQNWANISSSDSEEVKSIFRKAKDFIDNLLGKFGISHLDDLDNLSEDQIEEFNQDLGKHNEMINELEQKENEARKSEVLASIETGEVWSRDAKMASSDSDISYCLTKQNVELANLMKHIDLTDFNKDRESQGLFPLSSEDMFSNSMTSIVMVDHLTKLSDIDGIIAKNLGENPVGRTRKTAREMNQFLQSDSEEAKRCLQGIIEVEEESKKYGMPTRVLKTEKINGEWVRSEPPQICPLPLEEVDRTWKDGAIVELSPGKYSIVSASLSNNDDGKGKLLAGKQEQKEDGTLYYPYYDKFNNLAEQIGINKEELIQRIKTNKIESKITVKNIIDVGYTSEEANALWWFGQNDGEPPTFYAACGIHFDNLQDAETMLSQIKRQEIKDPNIQQYGGFVRRLSSTYYSNMENGADEVFRKHITDALELAYFYRKSGKLEELRNMTWENAEEGLPVKKFVKLCDDLLDRPLDKIGGAGDYNFQSSLREADKTVASWNAVSVCPMYQLGNNGCYRACYVTQQGEGAQTQVYYEKAMYNGELLQLSDGEIADINRLGGIRVNGAGDTDYSMKGQWEDFFRHAKMRDLKVKVVTKQDATLKIVSDLLKNESSSPVVTVQPSIDFYWVPWTEDKAIMEQIHPQYRHNENLPEEVTDVIKMFYHTAGRDVKVINGSVYKKYGFSFESFKELQELYPDLVDKGILVPRMVCGNPEEMYESLLHFPGKVIITAMHGRAPKDLMTIVGNSDPVFTKVNNYKSMYIDTVECKIYTLKKKKISGEKSKAMVDQVADYAAVASPEAVELETYFKDRIRGEGERDGLKEQQILINTRNMFKRLAESLCCQGPIGVGCSNLCAACKTQGCRNDRDSRLLDAVSACNTGFNRVPPPKVGGSPVLAKINKNRIVSAVFNSRKIISNMVSAGLNSPVLIKKIIFKKI